MKKIFAEVGVKGRVLKFKRSKKDGFYEAVGKDISIQPDLSGCYVDPWYADYVCEAPAVPFKVLKKDTEIRVDDDGKMWITDNTEYAI